MMNESIEKQIELNAPVSRVWQALTDHRRFGEWFGVNLEAPFIPGQTSRGQITIAGYEHVKFEASVQKMEPEQFFSYTWHPYAVDPNVDYSAEHPTLVEFKLEETAKGTLLTVTESGFDKIPANRRAEAFRKNEAGWAGQLENIRKYIAENRPRSASTA